jgi:RNA-dependent RNA polymerase
MESKYRTENQIYKSKKILGMLYDQIKLVDFQPQYENAFDSRIMNAFELDEAILNEAVSLKESYDSSLKRTMAKHAIRTEFEAWSVFVLSHNQEGSDYTFVQDFGVVVQILKDSTRESCLAASSGHGGLARFVAAMYTITAREMEEALKECRIKKTVGGQEVPVRKMDPENMPLMSFPWVFYDQLGRIATGNRSDLEPIIIPHGVRKQQKKHVDLDFDFDPALTAEANGNIETSEGILHYGELLKLDFSPMGSGRSSSMDVETRNRTDRVVRGTPSESIQLSFQATTQHGSARDGGSYQTPLRSGSEKTEINEKEKRREVKVMLDHRPSAVTKQLEK